MLQTGYREEYIQRGKRGNNRQTLFHTPGDYEAFVRAVKETLLIVPMRILAYCLMPNHWHVVLRHRGRPRKQH